MIRWAVHAVFGRSQTTQNSLCRVLLYFFFHSCDQIDCMFPGQPNKAFQRSEHNKNMLVQYNNLMKGADLICNLILSHVNKHIIEVVHIVSYRKNVYHSTVQYVTPTADHFHRIHISSSRVH